MQVAHTQSDTATCWIGETRVYPLHFGTARSRQSVERILDVTNVKTLKGSKKSVVERENLERENLEGENLKGENPELERETLDPSIKY